MEKLDPRAIAAANEAFWERNPGKAGQFLTMEPKDAEHRKAWMSHYRESLAQVPEPPAPQQVPQRDPNPISAVAGPDPCDSCGSISTLTHEEKMYRAYELAKKKLGDEIVEELPDPAVFVGAMAVVGGVLAVATFATGGLAAVAAGALIVLAVAGAGMTGYEIGQILNGLHGFFDKTRCDRARSDAELDGAAKDLADAIAKGGVATVMTLVTGMLGKAGTVKPLLRSSRELKDNIKINRYSRNKIPRHEKMDMDFFKREKIAMDFFKRTGMTQDIKKYPGTRGALRRTRDDYSHVQGHDLSKPVTETTLGRLKTDIEIVDGKEKKVIYQLQDPDELGKGGQYFTTDKDATADMVGVSDTCKSGKKKKMVAYVIEDESGPVLESTARGVIPYWEGKTIPTKGGAKQLAVPGPLSGNPLAVKFWRVVK